MNINHNNSLYCINPPTTIAEPLTPNELMEDAVAQHIDEEHFFISYLDIEEERNCELIENGEN